VVLNIHDKKQLHEVIDTTSETPNRHTYSLNAKDFTKNKRLNTLPSNFDDTVRSLYKCVLGVRFPLSSSNIKRRKETGGLHIQYNFRKSNLAHHYTSTSNEMLSLNGNELSD
jgi:hypothetical protein